MINLYNGKKNNHTLSDLPKKNGGPKPSFERYIDPTREFDSKELKYGLWYVKHKVLLYRLTVAALVIFSIATWLFSSWRMIDYIVFGIKNDQALHKNLATFYNYTGLHPHYAPEPITIINTRALPGGVDKYDAVAEVANSNSRFKVTFEYYFTVGGENTPRQKATLLPGENRPLVYFGLERKNFPVAISLALENVSWQRLSNKTIVDPHSWQAERLKFSVNNFIFTPANGGVGAQAHSIQFDVTNQSSYGYVEPYFYVGLLVGGDLVGILPLHLLRVQSLEKRVIDLRSFVPNLQVTAAQLFPLIDVYDPTVYLPPPK